MDKLKYIETNFDFDPVKDLAEVDQYGYIDIYKAFETNTIEAGVVTDGEGYNNYVSVDQIGGKPSDIFESIDANVNANVNSVSPATAGEEES